MAADHVRFLPVRNRYLANIKNRVKMRTLKTLFKALIGFGVGWVVYVVED